MTTNTEKEFFAVMALMVCNDRKRLSIRRVQNEFQQINTLYNHKVLVFNDGNKKGLSNDHKSILLENINYPHNRLRLNVTDKWLKSEWYIIHGK